jgi:hypothetical protein
MKMTMRVRKRFEKKLLLFEWFSTTSLILFVVVCRLLDICHGQRLEKEQQLVLFLVFEHVDQDLATYIERCPPPGLGSRRIKVKQQW